jgi:hypothetical protein
VTPFVNAEAADRNDLPLFVEGFVKGLRFSSVALLELLT